MTDFFTQREISILRHLNTKERTEIRSYAAKLDLLYKNELKSETISTYRSYLQELEEIEEKLFNMTKKLNGVD